MANYISSKTGSAIDTAVGYTEDQTTFGAASSGAAGSSGLVPGPAAGDQGKFLRGDATWQTVTSIPDQYNHNGELLSTNGVSALWKTIGDLGFVEASEKAAANGLATLNASSKVVQTALKAEALTDGTNNYTLGASVTAANVAQIGTNATNIETLQTDVASLKKQNEWIGRTTCVSGEEQTTLTAFVVSTVSRQPRQGDQVTITNYGASGQIWIYTVDTGTTYTWKFYSDLTPITDATTTTKGVVQIGDGINVNSGVIKPQLSSYTKMTSEAAVSAETADRNYAVVMDASGDLAVTVPWSDNNTHNSHAVTVISGKNASNADISATSESSTGNMSLTLGTSGVTAGTYGDTTAQTPGYGGTFSVPHVAVNAQGVVIGVGSHNVTMPSAQTLSVTNANATKLYLTGHTATTGSVTTLSTNSSIYITTGNVLMGAAWNDFAENRKCLATAGNVVCETGKGDLVVSGERLQAGAAVVSDTYGMLIGPQGEGYAPIAVAGRVLVYFGGEVTDYKAGDAVCAGPFGRIWKMTREEIKEYPDRIIGFVSEIPDYEEWNGVKVNNRIWIKLR